MMMTNWEDLECTLSKSTLTALKGLNFSKPTPIQYHAIPKFMTKKDIVAQAVTGSGKTLSFIIPIVELLNKSKVKNSDVFAVILTPTSELANQTYEMFCDFLKCYTDKKPDVRIFKEDSSKLNKADDNSKYLLYKKGIITNDKLDSNYFSKVIIFTPGSIGRFIDEYDSTNAFIRSLKTTEVLIMDEADRLLELGFDTQLSAIFQILPKQRVTCLFSATQTTMVEDLIKSGLRNPVRISIKVENKDEQSVIPSNLSNFYKIIENEEKLDYLLKFILAHKKEKILVFFATCCCVDYFYRVIQLIKPKLNLLALHKKVKGKRGKIFKEFKSMTSGVMFCTDLMARGVDVPNIDWVVQFDPPKQPSNFIHRIGRTARCEQSGQTLLLLRPNEETFVSFLSTNQEVNISEYEVNESIEDNVKIPDNFGEKMKDLCTLDRLLYEKSIRAFTSYIQFYKKHELQYLFILKQLNVGQLANSFGLLRIPKMNDLNKNDMSSFKEREIELKSLIYKDKSVRKVREKTLLIKQEQKLLKAKEAEEADDGVQRKKFIKHDGKSKNKQLLKKKDKNETKSKNEHYVSNKQQAKEEGGVPYKRFKKNDGNPRNNYGNNINSTVPSNTTEKRKIAKKVTQKQNATAKLVEKIKNPQKSSNKSFKISGTGSGLLASIQ